MLRNLLCLRNKGCYLTSLCVYVAYRNCSNVQALDLVKPSRRFSLATSHRFMRFVQGEIPYARNGEALHCTTLHDSGFADRTLCCMMSTYDYWSLVTYM